MEGNYSPPPLNSLYGISVALPYSSSDYSPNHVGYQHRTELQMPVKCWQIYENQNESCPPFSDEQRLNGALNSPCPSKTKHNHFVNILQAMQGHQCLFLHDSIFSVISRINRLNTRNSTKGCFFNWIILVDLQNFAIKEYKASLSKKDVISQVSIINTCILIIQQQTQIISHRFSTHVYKASTENK